MPKITKNTTLVELLENPKAGEILAKYHLPCLGCPFAEVEMKTLKIGEICKMYGINLEKLLTELSRSESEGGNERSSLTKDLQG